MDPPDSQSSPTPSRQCSVRGCKAPVAPDATTKMCEACRVRHRVYATTKRARRKMEKAYVTARLGGDANGSQAVNDGTEFSDINPPHWRRPVSPVATGNTQITTVTSWADMGIDSSLFPSHPASPYPSTVHQPLAGTFTTLTYPSSLSSELAGALTPLPASSVHQPQPQILPQHETPTGGDGTSDNDEEDEVSTTLQLQHLDPAGPVPSTPVPPAVDPQLQTNASASTASPNESLKYCTVKGCKAQIPASYEYKMCPACRTRYRTYGITKRAKWRAEREAFDRELIGLRTQEDERRQQAGQVPLADSPEELRIWELSILKEKGPYPKRPSPTPPDHDMEDGDGTADPSPEGSAIDKSSLTVISPTNDLDSPYSKSPYPVGPDQPLPVRMCTVSHCHKILPGSYRYKRCEEHRLQNRYHSNLKRLREKVFKGIGQEMDEKRGEESEDKGEGGPKDGAEQQRYHDEVGDEDNQGDGDRDGDIAMVVDEETTQGQGSATGKGKEQEKEKDKPKKRNFICATRGCHNLLPVDVRWRHCEYCRARERVSKKEKKEQEDSALKEIERLKEIVRRMEAQGAVPVPSVDLEPNVANSEAPPDVESPAVMNAEEQVPSPQSPTETVVQAQVNECLATSRPKPNVTVSAAPSSTSISVPLQSSVHDDLSNPPYVHHPDTSVSSITQAILQSVLRAKAILSTPPSTVSFPAKPSERPRRPKAAAVAVTASAPSAPSLPSPPSSMTTAATTATDQPPLTIREYTFKPVTMIQSFAQAPNNGGSSVQVLKDMMLPQNRQQKNTGLVGPSSYYVYKNVPPPVPPSSVIPTVFKDPLGIYKPAPKRARTDGGGESEVDTPTTSSEVEERMVEIREAKSTVPSQARRAAASSGSSGDNFAPPPPPTSSNAQSEQIHQPPATQAKGRKASTASFKVTPQPASSSPATSTSKSKPAPTDTTTSPSYPLPYPYSYHLSPSYSMTSYAINGAPPSASSMAPYPAPPGGGYPPPPSTAYPLAPSSIYPAPSSPSSPYYPSPYSPYPYPPYHAYEYPPPPHHPYSMTSPYGYPPNRYLPTPYQHPTPLPLHSPYHPHPHPSYPPVYGYPRGSTPPPYRSPPSNPTSGPNANASSSSSSSSSARQGVSAQTAVSAPNVASPKGKRKESDQDTTTAAAKGINTTAPAAETASSAIVAGVDPALTTMEVDATSAAGNGANSAGTTENDNEDAEETTAIIPNARQCGNKTCRRTIPANVTGAFCEKCRLRMKKHQAKARHWLKLEPRKSLLGVGRTICSTGEGTKQ